MKRTLISFTVFCLALICFVGCTGDSKTISDATLYTFNADSCLEYNAIQSACVSPDVKVHGCSINDFDSLTAIMGTADMPAEDFSMQVSERTLGKAVTANLTFDKENTITNIEITSVNQRPVVGISWKSKTIKQDYHQLVQILERNGAYAVYLPKITSTKDAENFLKNIDGVVLTGGTDINPSRFNQLQSPHGAASINNTRDISDITLARYAIETDIPLIAICRGMQVLNVALGGELIQDIPYDFGQKVISGTISSEKVTDVFSGRISSSDAAVADTGYVMYDETFKKIGPSYDDETGKYVSGSGCEEGHLMVEIDNVLHKGGTHYHGITVDAESRWLYEITGREDVPYVATYHHQALDPDKLGNGLTVVARAADGIVEAVEYQDNMFALGLQYHPEKDALADHAETDVDNEECNNYFVHLVRYALQHSMQ